MKPEIITSRLSVNQENDIRLFLKNHPYNTIFQSPDYYNFYLQLKNLKPIYFISRDKDHNIAGVLLAVIIREKMGILSFLSSRCVIYGGPIVKKDDVKIISAILEALNKYIGSKALFTQFRNFRIWPEEAQKIFQNRNFVLRERLNLILDLTNLEKLKAGFNAGRRRQLKKALAAGASITIAENLADVAQLYSILNRLYKTKVRKPLPDFSYFEQFFNLLMKNEKGIILLVKADGKIIGGIVSPITPENTISELYVCGLDKEYPYYYPSIVATWAAMEYGHKNNLKQFDFMGLGKPDTPYGVREFKLRFGGTQVNYGRFARRNNKVLYAIAEFGYNLLRLSKKPESSD